MIYLSPVIQVSPFFPSERRDVRRVFDSTTAPIIECLEQNPAFVVSLALNWSLVETWNWARMFQSVDRLKSLHEDSRFELLNTSAYHAVLPLLAPREVMRQLDVNQRRLENVFSRWVPEGVFPTEMAFGHQLAPAIKRLGMEYCLADDSAFARHHGYVPFSWIARQDDICVLLRSSYWSQRILSACLHGGDARALAQEFIRDLEDWMEGSDGYVVLAWHSAWFQSRYGMELLCSFLLECLDYSGLELVTPSGLTSLFSFKQEHVPPGSWYTTSEDYTQGDYYSYWQSSRSKSQQVLWDIAALATESVEILRDDLDRSLQSGTFSARIEEDESSEHAKKVEAGLKSLLDVIAKAAPEKVDEALMLISDLEHQD